MIIVSLFSSFSLTLLTEEILLEKQSKIKNSFGYATDEEFVDSEIDIVGQGYNYMEESVVDIAIDSNGDTIIAMLIKWSTFNENITINGITIEKTSSNSRDIAIIKIASNGTWMWGITGGPVATTSLGEFAGRIAIDGSDNIFLTGHFGGSASFGNHSISGGGQDDGFIAMMDNDGDWKWAKSIGGTYYDYANDVVGYPSGGAIVVGRIQNAVVQFGDTELESQSTSNTLGFMAKIEENGTWSWAEGIGDSGYNFAKAVDIDSNGDVIVAGEFSNNLTLGDFMVTESNTASVSIQDIFVAKYDETNSTWDWLTKGGGIDGSSVNDIEINSQNKIIVGGLFEGYAEFGNYNLSACNYTTSTTSDIMIVELSANGTWDSVNKMGSCGDDNKVRLGVDPIDNIFVAGYTTSNGFIAMNGTTYGYPTGTSSIDIFLAKLGHDGYWKWLSLSGGTSTEKYPGFVVDTNGNVTMVGSTTSTDWEVDGTTYSTNGGMDGFVLYLTPPDRDRDNVSNAYDSDDDNDGINDVSDSCSLGEIGWESGSWNDYDGDGCRDLNEDNDDDNDGVYDSYDSCPKGNLLWLSNWNTDFDNDGCQDSGEDTDDDNDGVFDTADSCLTYDQDLDTDFDGDGCDDTDEDNDDDNDGLIDSLDQCTTADFSLSVDFDGDGCDDYDEDWDDDNDGVNDAFDDCATADYNISADYDNDGCDDADEDNDDDNDGVEDSMDAFPLNANETSDHDGDGVGDNADSDDDGDGVNDTIDLFPLDANESADYDGDGVGDNADTDDDGDGVVDLEDAYPYNSERKSDLDTDEDGIVDDLDQCPETPEGELTDKFGCHMESKSDEPESSGIPGFTFYISLTAFFVAAIIVRRME